MDKKILYDVNQYIQEIYLCLENSCYLAALSMTLILPDICSKIEYKDQTKQNKSGKCFYIKWCNKWISKYLPSIFPIKAYQCSWGNIIYFLRCSILHNAKIDICNKNYLFFNLKNFNLFISKNDKDYTLKFHKFEASGDISDTTTIKIEMDINFLIQIICNGVIEFIKAKKISSDLFPKITVEENL